MKLFSFVFASFILLVVSSCEPDKGNSASEFKVWGNCEMCKETIESSLNKQPGIVKAEWDVKSKKLSVNYDSSAIKLNDIHKRIASVGYDTEKEKGDDQAYNSLHECCKYKRKE